MRKNQTLIASTNNGNAILHVPYVYKGVEVNHINSNPPKEIHVIPNFSFKMSFSTQIWKEIIIEEFDSFIELKEISTTYRKIKTAIKGFY